MERTGSSKSFNSIDVAWGCPLVKLYKFIECAVLGVVFFGVIVPIALFYRLRGRDPLNLKLHGAQKSYWIERIQVGLVPKSFYTQFIKNEY